MSKHNAVTVGLYVTLALLFAGWSVYSHFSSNGNAGVIIYGSLSVLYVGIAVVRFKKFRAAANTEEK